MHLFTTCGLHTIEKCKENQNGHWWIDCQEARAIASDQMCCCSREKANNKKTTTQQLPFIVTETLHAIFPATTGQWCRCGRLALPRKAPSFISSAHRDHTWVLHKRTIVFSSWPMSSSTGAVGKLMLSLRAPPSCLTLEHWYTFSVLVFKHWLSLERRPACQAGCFLCHFQDPKHIYVGSLYPIRQRSIPMI